MADASLVAAAGTTVADHERISKFCLVRLWGCASRSRSTDRYRLRTLPAGLYTTQSLGQIHFICSLMGVIAFHLTFTSGKHLFMLANAPQ